MAGCHMNNAFAKTTVGTKAAVPNTSSSTDRRRCRSLSSQCTHTEPFGASNERISCNRSLIIVSQTECSSASSYWSNACPVLKGGSM